MEISVNVNHTSQKFRRHQSQRFGIVHHRKLRIPERVLILPGDRWRDDQIISRFSSQNSMT